MDINKFNILAVDDLSFYKSLIQSHLDFMKVRYEIFYVSSVEKALETLKKQLGTPQQINMILCDLVMPGLSGTDLLESIKNSATFNGLPFILMTSEDSKDKLIDILNSGADSFLLKPWTVDQFKGALDAALKNKGVRYVAN